MSRETKLQVTVREKQEKTIEELMFLILSLFMKSSMNEMKELSTGKSS